MQLFGLQQGIAPYSCLVAIMWIFSLLKDFSVFNTILLAFCSNIQFFSEKDCYEVLNFENFKSKIL